MLDDLSVEHDIGMVTFRDYATYTSKVRLDYLCFDGQILPLRSGTPEFNPPSPLHTWYLMRFVLLGLKFCV